MLHPNREQGTGNRFPERNLPLPERLFYGTIRHTVLPCRRQVRTIPLVYQRRKQAAIQRENLIKTHPFLSLPRSSLYHFPTLRRHVLLIYRIILSQQRDFLLFQRRSGIALYAATPFAFLQIATKTLGENLIRNQCIQYRNHGTKVTRNPQPCRPKRRNQPKSRLNQTAATDPVHPYPCKTPGNVRIPARFSPASAPPPAKGTN